MLSHSRIPDPEDVRAMSDYERKAAKESPDVPSMPDLDEHGVSEEARQMWATRVAARWNDLRARRDAELHCRHVLALQRFSTPYEDLPSRLQNVLNQEIATTLRIFTARMTDRDFDYLSHDRRAKLEPEVGTAVQR